MPKKLHFGWVKEPHDGRDHIYAASPHVLGDRPDSVDLRPNFATPVWDQGSIGSCGPQTAAGDLIYHQERIPGPDLMPSRLYIYYNTRRLMGTVNEDSGVYNRTMMKALAENGWCREQLWPYIPREFTKKPSDECYA